jgi:protein ImuB
LCTGLSDELAHKVLGVRRLELVFGRVDRAAQAVQVKTARPNRDAAHLARLLEDRLDYIDPGFGIEDALLIASRVEPLGAKQASVEGLSRDQPVTDLAHLVDRLTTRLGEAKVYRQAPVESDLPERSIARVPPLAPHAGLTWPTALTRPPRLLDPPEPIEVMALVPDYPPAAFVWRHVRRRIVRADGPERVFGEWWRADDQRSAMRDYYRVEAADGSRFWVFRDGPAAEGARWFLHGLFA